MTPSNVATPTGLSAWSLIGEAGPLVKLILLILLFASVITWAIIFTKVKLIKKAKTENTQFLEVFWNSKALDDIHLKIDQHAHSPIAKVFAAGYRELRKLPTHDRTADGVPEMHNIERALSRTHANEIDTLESYMDFLASTASAAPFIGLFGTVWGS